MEAKISQMMAPGKGTIVSAFNVDIQKHDVQTLCNGKWLNDEVNYAMYVFMLY